MSSTPIPPQPTSLPGSPLRRRLLMAGALCPVVPIVGVPSARAAEPVSARLPASANLAAEIRRAVDGGSPLVVMVSLSGCPFCNVVRDSYLAPLRREIGLPVVQVDMRSAVASTDAKGGRTSHDELARGWKVRIAPTVLFLGRDGVELAERLVGGYLAEFYGAYLEQRLEQARRTLKA